jgi:hypothetical protein
MLDRVLKDNRALSEDSVNAFKSEFLAALRLARQVFGVGAFRLPSEEGALGALSRPVFDAQMVAMHQLVARREEILRSRAAIAVAVDALAQPAAASYELMVGRGNTADTIRRRIDLVRGAVEGAI